MNPFQRIQQFMSRNRPTQEEAVTFMEALLLKAGAFADQHDLLVPDLTIRFRGLEIGLTMRRLPKG